jgi:hypothetical protein
MCDGRGFCEAGAEFRMTLEIAAVGDLFASWIPTLHECDGSVE